MKTVLKRILHALLLAFGSTMANAQTGDTLSIYPNPFLAVSNAHFVMSQPDSVFLVVYNRWGKIVETPIPKADTVAGDYTVSFGDSLANGVYFVHLKVGTISQNRYAIKGVVTYLSENTQKEEVPAFFPNPVTDRLHIPVEGRKTILINDVSGKTVKTITTDEKVISMSELPAGQYIIGVLNASHEMISVQSIAKK